MSDLINAQMLVIPSKDWLERKDELIQAINQVIDEEEFALPEADGEWEECNEIDIRQLSELSNRFPRTKFEIVWDKQYDEEVYGEIYAQDGHVEERAVRKELPDFDPFPVFDRLAEAEAKADETGEPEHVQVKVTIRATVEVTIDAHSKHELQEQLKLFHGRHEHVLLPQLRGAIPYIVTVDKEHETMKLL